MINDEYLKAEYNEFLRYVRGTWGPLFENDWEQEPEIDKIIIYKHKNSFKVYVYLKENTYWGYDFKKRELYSVKYDTDKAIKTHYDLDDDIIAYMLFGSSIVEDLKLQDVEIRIFDFVDGLEIEEELTRRLDDYEQDYAETLYCIIHDL